ncbi:beta-trefoil DNA-binding domain-containing protein [Lobosporangium transversale]|uniref:Beta-trefoil DNA-binding domain-containing protein n=1 Tax=Lobosporangium transversale TaxID=64571 RepID=A0A1Y2H1Q1_9FUNG|nr:beta-trefoil DNA-binding domain-containing protein [Lobosporangium transversale]ORZ26972.1 beta-trefoil DNA-binding domain-containing protein [Lobosporangium transversale]|eukprot:XP_021884719.1 beta-trefoil DNA-binding domain-containing protein [Lobosporangium transversale]
MKASSPTFSTIDINKRKWSNLSSANFEEERNAKIRRSIQDHVSAHANQSLVGSESEPATNFFPRQVFDSKDPSARYQMTTICCLHASVAQKSYGSEKRFLCPPPIVNIQAPQGDSKSALSSKPQVTMSVVCESGDNNNQLGQRSTLEDDHTGTFRYLYVTGSAKAKSFQLKLQVYGRACLPNGFISNGSSEAEEGVINTADLPEPYAVFDSAPIAIISKPSKKTAKARNVSSCILAGSLVSLFNRINSQTVRTKYMSVQDGEFCAKNSTWSSFSITIVSNSAGNPNTPSTTKSHHRQSAAQSSVPITYGSEIILTETATGLKSDRLIVCKVENGRIQENASGPICQMQKVALMSMERSKDGEPLYLSAVGNDHQVGRYMDHSSSTKTVLKYQPSTITGGNIDIMKPGSDDFLCWTIVGISKFEYTYFESLPADSESHHPITPFPTLMKNPVYNAASHTLELVVSNFYSQIGDQRSEMPMNVWLGSRGPLTTRIIRRSVSGMEGNNVDRTTLLVELPQGNIGATPEEKSLSLPLLFVRNHDGITYNSRATVVFTRPEHGDRWSVSMA